ncbi:MAG: UDP-N-acetylmuramoyl-tripeptide--D-alanyl-D-alanine ligase [Opitutales bacterium]
MKWRFDSEKLADWTGGTWSARPEGVSGFCHDTRKLQAGEMFVALKTERRDGHDFLDTARELGATAALVSKIRKDIDLPQLEVGQVLPAFQAIARGHRRRFQAPVAGITGSAGKTSTKDLLALLLGRVSTLSTPANENNLLGVPLTLSRLDASRHQTAVIEAGISERGEMARLATMISPDVAIVTLVASVHLEGLGSLEGVAYEKSLLPAAMAADGCAFFPASCLRFSEFRAFGRRAVVTSASTEEPRGNGSEQWVTYQTETEEGGGARLTIVTASSPLPPLFLQPVGPGMVSNAVLAILAALHMGVSVEQIQPRLDQWQPSTLRGQWIEDGPRTLFADCYNASPPSMAEALAVFTQRFPVEGQTPRLFLLGCMAELGAQAEAFHREAGRALRLGPADQVLLIGESAEAFREGLVEGGASARQVALAESVDAMAEVLSTFAGAVLVKGSRRYGLEKLLPVTSSRGDEAC